VIRELPAATGSQEVGNPSAAVTFEINAPGCSFRFPLSEPVPMKLIGGIANLRAKEVAEREKAKAAARWAPARSPHQFAHYGFRAFQFRFTSKTS
jgi:hypothetical protein